MTVSNSVNLTPSNSRPTWIEINLECLSDNLKKVKKRVANSKAKIMAVIKAQGYGHGLIESANEFLNGGAEYFGVALLEEALALRSAGISTPILVFGGIASSQIDQFILNDLDITASSVSKVEQIDEVASKLRMRAKVHLKIDTGMERIGQHYYSCDRLLDKATQLKNIDIIGIYSHFACADHENLQYTKLQLERFLECMEFFPRHSIPTPLRHIANSAALARIDDCHLDLVRPGIALYGVEPFSGFRKLIDVRPALRLYSTVVYFKVVRANTGISYGHSYKTSCDTRIVTIPIGYGDGYPRSLSNLAPVIIHNQRYPVAGSICMDQLMVDLGPSGEAFNGERVTLIGDQVGEQVTVEELARLANTIPYEILTNLNPRIPRKYI